MLRATPILVLVLLGSGCSTPPGTLQMGDGAAPEHVGDGPVRIAGTVVDDAQQPVGDVRVAAANATSVSGPDGRFELGGLAAGPVMLTATHPAFVLHQASLVLVDGQTLELLIPLSPLPSAAPHVRTLHERGFLACSIPVGGLGGACVEVAGGGHKDVFAFNVERRGLGDLLGELVWESTLPGPSGPLAGRLGLFVDQADGSPFAWRTGYRYVRLPMDAGKAFEGQPPGTTELRASVRVPPTGCPILCGGDPGSVAWQQPYDVHLSAAYHRAFGPEESFAAG